MEHQGAATGLYRKSAVGIARATADCQPGAGLAVAAVKATAELKRRRKRAALREVLSVARLDECPHLVHVAPEGIDHRP